MVWVTVWKFTSAFTTGGKKLSKIYKNKKQDILTLCQDYYYDGTCQCQNKLSDLYPLSVSWSTELFQDFLHPNKEFHYPVEINKCMEEIGHVYISNYAILLGVYVKNGQ